MSELFPFLLIVFFTCSLLYTGINDSIIAKRENDNFWRDNAHLYKFQVEYSDKPSVIYFNMFNDDNRRQV